MRLDTAGRNFTLLALASLVGFVIVGMGACTLLSVIAYRAARDGSGAVTENAALFPAMFFLVVAGVGLFLAVASIARQVRCSRALGRRVAELALPMPDPIARAAETAGLAGRVVLVAGEEPFSFAFGAFRPRVAVSRPLLEAASSKELDAVLEHERYHVRNLDPLRVLLARALPAGLFYVPALARLRTRYVAGRELAADRHAIRRHGRGALAGALAKVLRGPQWPELSAAAAIGGPDLLDARIAQLETGVEPPIGPLPTWVVALSIGSALLLGASLATALAGLGPGPNMTADDSVAATAFMIAACAAPWLVGGLLGWIWLNSRRTA
jgi:beta-lactamase regulating signal transducer with metallopeptidase domain